MTTGDRRDTVHMSTQVLDRTWDELLGHLLDLNGQLASTSADAITNRKEDMMTDQTIDHPARIGSLIEALRRTSEGQGVAETLEFIFDKAPDFRLRRTPTDEWQYIEDLLELFGEKRDLALASFMDAQYALLVGVEIGEALAVHRRG